MKNYIASEEAGCMTSAAHVRKLFNEAIRLGRSYARSGNKAELYEAMRLLGTGTHCLEDFSAHSNYVELALIEMGEREVFPHVGSRTQMRLQGARTAVYPLITGTFGGVDFLHSMMGEFDDKATQSEIQTLESTIQQGSQGNTSMLKAILDKIPDGLFGSDQKGKADELQQNSNVAAMQNMHVTPKRPEAFTLQMQQMVQQIYPIMEYHDEIMQQITAAIEKIPILPELLEQLENEVNVFVFSLLAPFVLPLIQQLKSELNEGSSEIIASSKDKQHIVFNDTTSTDPTHSMLSKDHFSNVLNEPAGKVASAVLKWAVPQIISAMDDERIDSNRVCSRIINGVFHHPALRTQGDDGASQCRDLMFQTVQNWWQRANQNDLRQRLSEQGVLNGDNHEGSDTGHGSAGGLKMHSHAEGCGAGEGLIGELLGALSGNAGGVGAGYGRPEANRFAGQSVSQDQFTHGVQQALGDSTPLGGILGGPAGAAGVGGLLSGVLGGGSDVQSTHYESSRIEGNAQVNQYTEFGRNEQGGFAQASVERRDYGDGRVEERIQEYEQNESGYGGSGRHGHVGGRGYEAVIENHGEQVSGYERTFGGEEPSYQHGRQHHKKEKKYGHGGASDDSDSGNDSGDSYKKQKKREKKERKEREKREERERRERHGGYGGREDVAEQGGGYGRQEPPRQEYGAQEPYGRQPPRQEYGGESYGHQSPRHDFGRQEFGGPGFGGSAEYGGPPPRQEYGGDSFGGGGFGGAPRAEYGGGPPQDFRGGRRPFADEFEDGPPQEFGGGRGDFEEGFGGGGRGGYGGGERQEDYGRLDEGYGLERRDEGDGFGGGYDGGYERRRDEY